MKQFGKAHLKGTSKKTGNPYDFIRIHYNSPAFGVEGVAACTLVLRQYPYDHITIGGEYNAEFDSRGYLVEFAPVTKG